MREARANHKLVMGQIDGFKELRDHYRHTPMLVEFYYLSAALMKSFALKEGRTALSHLSTLLAAALIELWDLRAKNSELKKSLSTYEKTNRTEKA
jgi:hypothetical protein